MTLFFLVLAGILAAAGAAYWFWARRAAADIAESAGQKWAQLQGSDLVAGLDEQRFRAAFHRTHFPRFPRYALAMLAAFIVVTPATFAILAAFALLLDAIGWSNADALAQSVPVLGAANAVSRDEGETIALYYVQDVMKFYYYFGLVFAWLAIVYFVMRRFHRRRPGYLEDEILKEKARG